MNTKNQYTAMLMDVKRFAVHDGPGLRTTLFLKGCPLHCIWCHNPEGISKKPQLAYYTNKCLHCMECVNICPQGAHKNEQGLHLFVREQCTSCGLCQSVCLGEALSLFGKIVTIEEALRIVLEDRIFFEESGGGVTLSGGEPLLQADFCKALLTGLHTEGISTAVDTSGCVPWSSFQKVINVTDIFLFDIKHMDSKRHRELTGVSNEKIIKNLRMLSEREARIEIRIPLIPGYNDDNINIDAICSFLFTIRIERVRLLPYHDMARNKYCSLGMEDTLPQVMPSSAEALMRVYKRLQNYGINVISEL